MPSPADFIAQAEGDWSVDRRTDRRGRRSFRSCGGTGPVSAVPMARLSLTPSARTARYWKAWEGAAPGGGITSTPLPLGLVRPDHDRQARRSYATAVNEMLAVGRRSHYRHWDSGSRCRMFARTRADPIQIGASGDKDREIKQDDPS